MASPVYQLHVRTSDLQAVVDVLRFVSAVPAYVSNESTGWVSAFPRITDRHEKDFLEFIAQTISTHLDTTAFAHRLFDGGVFYFSVFDKGSLLDSYNSNPGYEEYQAAAPEGGKIDVLLPYCVPGTTEKSLRELLHDLQGVSPQSGELTDIPADQLMQSFGMFLGLGGNPAMAGYDLLKKGVVELPGATFIEETRGEEPVEIFSTGDEVEAVLVKGLLESHGVQVFFIPQQTKNTFPYGAHLASFSVLVSPTQASWAKKVCAEYVESRDAAIAEPEGEVNA